MSDDSAFTVLSNRGVVRHAPWVGVIAYALSLAFVAFLIATFHG